MGTVLNNYIKWREFYLNAIFFWHKASLLYKIFDICKPSSLKFLKTEWFLMSENLLAQNWKSKNFPIFFKYELKIL